MTLTLELAPEQEAQLRARAEALGLTPDGYLKKLAGIDDAPIVEPEVVPAEQEPYYNPAFEGKTLADVLAGHIGTVNSAERNGNQVSHLSERTGEAFTEYLLEKHRKGRF